MSDSTPVPRLQAGGSLRKDALYIQRAADEELFVTLRAGQFAYVLAPRQIGKSSLRLRTAERLEDCGVACVHVDLSLLGKTADRDPISTWYFSVIGKLARDLKLADPKPIWAQKSQLLPADAFGRYLCDEVLRQVTASIVVFVDEIDYVRNLPFDTDEFFATIRALYNARSEEPDLGRLTFCLLGCAAPADLIQNPDITPFNIGRGVRLLDFRRDEINGFADALPLLGGELPRWLDAIYEWTRGHPYLLQALCEKLLQTKRASNISVEEQVANVVRVAFLRRGRTDDPTLSYAAKRIDSDDNEERKGELLALYRRLLDGIREPLSGGDAIQVELMLCGLASAVEEGGETLVTVRNPIVAQVFDKAWLQQKEAQRALTVAMRRWEEGSRSTQLLLRDNELEAARAWADAHARDLSSDEHAFLRLCLEHAREQAEAARLATQATLAQEQQRHIEERASAQRRFIWLLMAIIVVLALALTAFTERTFSLNRAKKDAEEKARAAKTAKEDSQQAAERERQSRKQAEVFSAMATRNEQLAIKEADERLVALQQAALAKQHADEAASEAISAKKQLAMLLDSEKRRREAAERDKQTLQARLSALELEQGVTSDRARLMLLRGKELQALLLALEAVEKAVVEQRPLSPPVESIFLDIFKQVWEKEWQRGLRKVLPEMRTQRGMVTAALFLPSGNSLLTTSSDGRLAIYDVATGDHLDGHNSKTGVSWLPAISSDGKVAIAANDNSIMFFTLSTGETDQITFEADSFTALASAPNDMMVIVSDRQQSIYCLQVRPNLSGDRKIATLKRTHNNTINHLEISRNGNYALSASEDNTAKLWSLPLADPIEKSSNTPQLVAKLTGHLGGVLDAVFANSGELAATASRDHTARIWRLPHSSQESISPPLVLVGHRAPVVKVRFSPDERLVATASKDGTARLWDAATGELRATLSGHKGGLNTVEFSPDGKKVVTASDDGTSQLFRIDLPAGVFPRDAVWLKSYLTLPGHSGFVSIARFSPNGRWIVTGGQDGRIGIYPSDLLTYVEVACRYLRRQPDLIRTSDVCRLPSILR